MSSSIPVSNLSTIKAIFDKGAAGYDDVDGGWHIRAAEEFIQCMTPLPGERLLDLACGTGLVTLSAAEAVGEDGTVVGIDVSEGMLNLGREKESMLGQAGRAKIEWVNADVCRLDKIPSVMKVLEDDGGFDIISCCCALKLLGDAQGAFRHWTHFLKPGGRIIVNMETEKKNLQALMAEDMRAKYATGISSVQQWVTGQSSLEELARRNGLIINKCWRTDSYTPVTVFNEDQGEEVFEQQIKDPKKEMLKMVAAEIAKRKDEARETWREIWKTNLDADGNFEDGTFLYVLIATRP